MINQSKSNIFLTRELTSYNLKKLSCHRDQIYVLKMEYVHSEETDIELNTTTNLSIKSSKI